MGGFDDYIQKKRQQEELFKGDQERQNEWQPIDLFHQDYKEETYEKQQKKGLGEDVEDDAYSYSFIEENMRLKEANSTFAERTDYYFKDPKYMEAKASRYRSLADDEDGEMEAFAKKHTNRSAKKRKDKATAAAQSFEKAQKLEEQYEARDGDHTLPAEKIYESRAVIMRARMEGMINAAKVKAKSDEDEKYRIAKAKLSCLTRLNEQAEHLRDRKSKYFDKVQAKLQKQIESAKADLKKYSQDPTAKWFEGMGFNDEESLKKELDEANNPNATIEDVKMQHIYHAMSFEFTRPEYVKAGEAAEKHKAIGAMTSRRDQLTAPTYIVKRDKQGNPINKEEKKKEEWNNRWLEACSDPGMVQERKKMLIESFERFKRIDIPSPEEVQKKGLANLLREDPARMYTIQQFSLRLDNLREADPIVSEYMQFDKLLRAKMEVARHIAQLMADTLIRDLNISEKEGMNLIKGDKYPPNPGEEDSAEARQQRKAEYWEDFRASQEMEEEKFQKSYELIAEAEKEEKKEHEVAKDKRPISFEEGKEQARYKRAPVYTEEGYKVYLEFKNTNQQMICPAYKAIYRETEEKLGGNISDLSRICGAMLRQVHFNDQWEPVSNEDMAAHEWNIKYLLNLHTYYNGPILEGMQQEAYDSAKEKLNKGKITKEQYEKTSIVETMKKRQEDAEKELKSMVEEELLKTFTGGYLDLPSPELLEEKVVKPLEKGEQPDSAFTDEIMANMEMHMLRAQKCLSLEGTLKREFAKDIKEKYGKLFDAFHQAHTFYLPITEYCFSHRFGVIPNAGTNAEFGGTSITKPEEVMGLVSTYKEFYANYQTAKAKFKTAK